MTEVNRGQSVHRLANERFSEALVPIKKAGAAGQIGHVPAPLLEDQLEAGAQGIPPISERRDTPLRLLIRLQIPRKTLAAAVIKLFLRSGNARRVLFLVDRLELV
jgi:hypothetical protein